MLKDDMGPDFGCDQDRDHSIMSVQWDANLKCVFYAKNLATKILKLLLPSNFSNKLAQKLPQEEGPFRALFCM